MTEFVVPMNGTEIANELGVTRQAISNILRRTMKKFYLQTRKLDKDWGPFETSCAMLRMLNVDNDIAEVKKFYLLFPKDIRDKIEADALENHCSKNMKEKVNSMDDGVFMEEDND
jgi:predicted transcriptional regulator